MTQPSINLLKCLEIFHNYPHQYLATKVIADFAIQNNF